MKPVKQSMFGPHGIYWQACIASLLELPLNDVPDFHREGAPGHWYFHAREWFKSRGLNLTVVEIARLSDLDGGPLIVSGKRTRGFRHAVIVENGNIVHDPHPDGGGLVEGPYEVDIITPIDYRPFTVLGATVEIETPAGERVTLNISIVEEESSPFPPGIGCWKYVHTPEFDGWFAEHMDFAQMWSPAQQLSGVPFWCEIKTLRKDHLVNWDVLRGRLRMLAANPDCVGVGVDIEAMEDFKHGWTWEKFDEAWEIVGEEFPRAKRFMGPIGYAKRWKPKKYFARADGIVTFINVSRKDRDPADLWYFLAAGAYYGKPLCQGVQPQDAEGVPADTKLFAEGIRIAGYADSAIVWRADAAAKWPEITSAIDSYVKRRRPREVSVLLSDHPDANRRAHFDKALCRIVGDAGRRADGGQDFIPALTDDPDEADVRWSDLALPPDYIYQFVVFYDIGNPARYHPTKNPVGLPPDEVRENLRKLERDVLAQQVRALLGREVH